MINKVYILGTKGFSIEVTEYIHDNNKFYKEHINIEGYFDIDNSGYLLNNFTAPYLGNEKEFYFPSDSSVVIAIADPKAKSKTFDFCKNNNINLSRIIHHSCFVSEKSIIKDGCILCPFVTITSNATIGFNFHANIYSYIAHDCIIGNNVTFAPSVKCNGNVHIGDNVYIGTGSIIKQGKSSSKPLKIGKNSTISAGAYVTKDVPEGMTVFGNPAIEFTKENIRRRS